MLEVRELRSLLVKLLTPFALPEEGGRSGCVQQLLMSVADAAVAVVVVVAAIATLAVAAASSRLMSMTSMEQFDSCIAAAGVTAGVNFTNMFMDSFYMHITLHF